MQIKPFKVFTLISFGSTKKKKKKRDSNLMSENNKLKGHGKSSWTVKLAIPLFILSY